MLNRNKYKGKSGVTRIKNAFFFSIAGIRSAWKEEEAFRQIIFVFVVLCPCSIFIARNLTEFILLLLPAIICIIIELINTAIENISDAITKEKNSFIKKAKDMGSAAQLISQCLLFITWIIFILGL